MVDMCPEKFSCLLTVLWIGIITATTRDGCQYSNDLLQGGLEVCQLHFYVYGCSLADAGTVITNSTLMQGNFWYIISLYILQQHHFPIVK